MRRARLEKYREAVRSVNVTDVQRCSEHDLGCAYYVYCVLCTALLVQHPLYIMRKILHQHTLRYYEYESKSTGTQQATAYLVNQKYKIMGTVRLYSREEVFELLRR